MKPKSIDDFVLSDESKIKWSRDLKLDLLRGNYCTFTDEKIVEGIYRPFCKKLLFFDRILNEEIYQQQFIFPPGSQNQAICCTVDSQIEFSALAIDQLPNHGLGQRPGQNFPFWVYGQADLVPRENIKDAALHAFRSYYSKPDISKWQVFFYIYAVLHHPAFRAKYSENLKKELPRIPFAPNFQTLADIGAQLAKLHLDYETIAPHLLVEGTNPIHPRSYRIESAIRYTNKDKTAIQVNDYLTLSGIPPEAHEYRIGSRSAIDWVLEMYRITEDKRSGISQDPNRPDEPEYIVNLVGRVTRVSLDTVAPKLCTGKAAYAGREE